MRITVDAFSIHGVEADTARFEMRISAGGYVRAIAHAMGEALECGAHLASLRRTSAGLFTLEESLTLGAGGDAGGGGTAGGGNATSAAVAGGDAVGDGR